MRGPPHPLSLSERFRWSAGKHFVTLSCVQTLRDGAEKVLVFSGFVVEAKGEWFYVTAGHILRDITRALAAGYKFDIWRLDDQAAGRGQKAIPLDFDSDRWLVLDYPEIGMDYAALHVEGLYRSGLEAGGVEALGFNSWSDHLAEHDHWALLGIPSESVTYDGISTIKTRIVVAPIVPTDAPPQAGRKAENQFYGRLNDDPDGIVSDIDGMSGGPIFNLKKIDGTWKYSVIGVQSAWYEKSRIIAACPFSSLGKALEQIVTDARAALNRSKSFVSGAGASGAMPS